MDQVVWNTAHGHFFQLTQPNGVVNLSRFSVHADIFLAFLAPLYWIYSSPYVLLFFQVVIVALGSLPLYWLARDILKNKSMALIIAISYLLFGPLQRAVIFDFHAVTLASSFLMFAFYYLYKEKYWPFIIFSILAVSTKETMGFLVITMGIYAILTKRKWWVGLLVIIASCGWFYALLWHIMPASRIDDTAHFAIGYYSKYGSTPKQIVETIILKPYKWIPDLLTLKQLEYLLIFILPTGFLALLTPIILLALPEFLINMLSNDPLMRQIYYQYTAAIAPFAFIALVFGVVKFRKILTNLFSKYKSISTKKIDTFICYFLVFFTIVSALIMSPLPGMPLADTNAFTYRLPAANYIKNLAKTIPNSAAVSASNTINPYFSERINSYWFPVGVEKADYVLVNSRDIGVTKSSIQKLEEDSDFKLIYKNSTVEIFQRK
jgi:uncharacterized membrane protein